MSKNIEIEIAERAIKALLAAGYTLDVNDGEEFTLTDSKDPSEIVAKLRTTDEDRLYARRDGKRAGWVWLIWGNDEDVICFHTVNLEAPLKPVFDWIDKRS